MVKDYMKIRCARLEEDPCVFAVHVSSSQAPWPSLRLGSRFLINLRLVLPTSLRGMGRLSGKSLRGLRDIGEEAVEKTAYSHSMRAADRSFSSSIYAYSYILEGYYYTCQSTEENQTGWASTGKVAIKKVKLRSMYVPAE